MQSNKPMNWKSTLRRTLFAATLAAGGLAFAAPANAGNRALLDTLVANDVITEQQAANLRRQTNTVVTPNRGTVSELKIRGRIQGQFAYSDGSNRGVLADAGDYSSFELRRTRLGVQGRLLDDWRFLVEANVLSDTDLDSGILTYAAVPEANVTFGKAKPQFGHEENTSSASILTMERSRLTGLFNGGKPLGLRVHGGSGIFSYYLGVYNGQTVSTSRMARDLDSYLWNASAGFKLDEVIGNGTGLRFRLDYLHSDEATGFYRFEDALAASGHLVHAGFDLRAEYMWGERHNDGNIRGFYVMPSIFLVPDTIQAVFRYEYIKGDDGVALGHNRYADRVPGLFAAGNRYDAYYLGSTYYIAGDNLKLMAGVERAENRDASAGGTGKGRATTFIAGVRMQF